MVDIDYFKQYNDHYGHLEGDACLKRAADMLVSAVTRPRDFVARFGGDEFVLVLPETDENAARHVAERCIALFAKAHIPHSHAENGSVVTVSLGAATIIPSHGDELLSFMAIADRQLYQAKRQGRNSVVFSD
jgi:diguanylate cyclase (GGDEF)-like protein